MKSTGAVIRWNVAELQFDKSEYSKNEEIILRLIEPDLNLNPSEKDHVEVKIISDKSLEGIVITLEEINDNFGIFERIIITNNPEGEQLVADIGDEITAMYTENTIPIPNGELVGPIIASTTITQ